MGLIDFNSILKNLATKKWRGIFAVVAVFLSLFVCTSTLAHAEKPFVSVCDRSVGIQRALIEKLEKPCDQITRKDLNEISIMSNILPVGKTTIKTGDLNDLTNLESLSLEQLNIEIIGAGTFKDLINLTRLFLDSNLLLDLDPKVFQGLIKLKVLSLRDNRIKQLHKNIFVETPSLAHLDLSYNGLSSRDNEYLEGLKGLTHFTIENNGWTEITPGFFDHLKKLKVLALSGPDLQFVPDGMFANLLNLKEVDFNGSPLKQTSRAALIGVPLAIGLPRGFGDSQLQAESPWD